MLRSVRRRTTTSSHAQRFCGRSRRRRADRSPKRSFVASLHAVSCRRPLGAGRASIWCCRSNTSSGSSSAARSSSVRGRTPSRIWPGIPRRCKHRRFVPGRPTSRPCSTDESVTSHRRCQRCDVLSFHGLSSPSRSESSPLYTCKQASICALLRGETPRPHAGEPTCDPRNPSGPYRRCHLSRAEARSGWLAVARSLSGTSAATTVASG